MTADIVYAKIQQTVMADCLCVQPRLHGSWNVVNAVYIMKQRSVFWLSGGVLGRSLLSNKKIDLRFSIGRFVCGGASGWSWSYLNNLLKFVDTIKALIIYFTQKVIVNSTPTNVARKISSDQFEDWYIPVPIDLNRSQFEPAWKLSVPVIVLYHGLTLFYMRSAVT